jgi:hypothetical protein
MQAQNGLRAELGPAPQRVPSLPASPHSWPNWPGLRGNGTLGRAFSATAVDRWVLSRLNSRHVSRTFIAFPLPVIIRPLPLGCFTALTPRPLWCYGVMVSSVCELRHL